MIKPSIYKSYWKHCNSVITELKSYHVVATEEGLGKKIKDIDSDSFPALIAILPSADPNSYDIDSVLEKNQALIFVLMRRGHADKSDAVFIADMDLTQDVMKKVKELMEADYRDCDSLYHETMARLNIGSFHQDPEYNYLGCDGWSLSFSFDTIGF